SSCNRAARNARKNPPRRREQPPANKPDTAMTAPAVPPPLTDAGLRLLQTLVYQECGMHFDERRTHFLQDRLLRRLRECQLDSFYSYYRLLISDDGKQELARLLENLTINETSFFRNKAQLDLFHKFILEDILHKKQARRDFSLRVWSAGCSTGQEPYTMTMLICDALAYYYLRNPLPMPEVYPRPLVPPPWKVEVMASDISYSVLRAGQEASYNESQMSSVDYSYRLRYFNKIGDRYAVKKTVELRELFFETAQELIQALNEEALKLEKKPGDREVLRSIRRIVHTLKGDAAACGYRELSELAHEFEDVLALETGSTEHDEIAEVALAAADVFAAMIDAYRKKKRVPSAQTLRARIHKLAAQPAKTRRKKSSASLHFAWSEYERVASSNALSQGKNVFNIAAQIDSACAMPVAARQLI